MGIFVATHANLSSGLPQAAALATCQFLAAETSRPPPVTVEEATIQRQLSSSESVPQKSKVKKSKGSKPSGTDGKKKKLNKQKSPRASTTILSPLVQALVEMGFPQANVEYALKELDEDSPRPELVVAWLLEHPDVEVA